MLSRCLIFHVLTPLYFAHLDNHTGSHSFCDVQDLDIPWVVAPLVLVSTSSTVIRETHRALLTTVVVAQANKPLLPCGQ
jgi:hypothetical protein